jgi:DNA-binding PadR family transcriptional regulator
MNTNSPYDQPWDGPRRRPGGPGGPRGGRPGGGFGGPRGGRGGSWAGGTPPWVQGLLDMAQGNQHGFGRGGPFGGGPSGRRGGPKVRRGDVRAAILDVLSHEPMNGYQIIQQIAERSGGAWKPSPGSVYPTVQQLEDEGLVEGSEGAGRRLLQLSDEGRSYVEAHPEELAATWRPFEQPDEDEGPGDLKPVIGQVMGAVWQVVVSGTKQQQAEAAEILADTRRKLYGILADGDDEGVDAS